MSVTYLLRRHPTAPRPDQRSPRLAEVTAVEDTTAVGALPRAENRLPGDPVPGPGITPCHADC